MTELEITTSKLQQLENENAQLKADKERVEKEKSTLLGKAFTDRQALLDLTKERDSLLAAIKEKDEVIETAERIIENYRYGHFAYCDIGLGPDRECNCGLEPLLATWRDLRRARSAKGMR